MKKSLVFLAVPLAVLALAAIAVPASAQAQVACPAGYVCTPISTQQPVNCPPGYICAPVTGGSGGASGPGVGTNTGGSGSSGGGSSGGGGGSVWTPSCYVFSVNLKIGSTGADVVALQTWLIANGYDIPAITQDHAAKGYYGPSTAGAVASYQRSKGINESYFGPLTRSSINGSCTTTPPQNGQPSITSVAGKAAGNGEIDAGGTVGIQGTNLAGYKDSTNVYIGGKVCTITQLGNTLIYCIAPSDLQVGNIYDLYINTVGAGGDKVTSNIVQVKVLSNLSQPFIAVTYPKAGYSLDNSGVKDSGLIANIQWTSSNTNNLPIEIDLINASGMIVKYIATYLPNTGSYAWHYDSTIPDGTYKILVSTQAKEGTPGSAAGQSGYFTLSGNTGTTPVCPAGYICTPVGQTPFCPSGYTCAPVTINCPVGYTCTTYASQSKLYISSMTGSSGTAPGSPLTINGSGFTNGDAVYFLNSAGVLVYSAVPSSVSPLQISLYIPSSLNQGTYLIQVGYGDARSNSMALTVSTGASVPAPSPVPSCIDSSNPYAGYSQAKDATLTFQGIPTANEDHAGQWGQFFGNGTPDYNMAATLSLTAPKTIKALLINTGYRGMSGTTQSCVDGVQPWPVVVFTAGAQVNTGYDQTLGSYPSGSFDFKIFGNKGPSDPAFTGTKLVMYFTDGTYAVSNAAAISTSPSYQAPTVSTPPVQAVKAYISSVTTPITDGQAMTVIGSNLIDPGVSGSVFIDGIQIANQVNATSDGTGLSFLLPHGLSTGPHSVYVQTHAGGMSNTLWFQVQPPSTGSNTPPHIVSTQPIPTLQAGQTFGFTWTAADAQNDDLSWSVDWGDGTSSATPAAYACLRSGSNPTFKASHAWASSGLYTVNAKVSDCSGSYDVNTIKISILAGPTIASTTSSLSASIQDAINQYYASQGQGQATERTR